jgi:hypothetical protein
MGVAFLSLQKLRFFSLEAASGPKSAELAKLSSMLCPARLGREKLGFNSFLAQAAFRRDKWIGQAKSMVKTNQKKYWPGKAICK